MNILDTPNGISTRKFKDTIRNVKWSMLGVGALRHKTKIRSGIRRKLDSFQNLAGYSYNSNALENGINIGYYIIGFKIRKKVIMDL